MLDLLGGTFASHSGIVIVGVGCTPIGILVSLLLSAILTLLANLIVHRRRD
jgi:hypothetical protein